ECSCRWDRRGGNGSSRSGALLHLEVGVLDVLVATLLATLGARARPRLLLRPSPGSAAQLLAELVHRLLELLPGALHRRLVLALRGLAQVLDLLLELALELRRHLALVLLQRALERVGHAVGLVARVDDLAALLVLGRVLLGVLAHLVDLGLGEPG